MKRESEDPPLQLSFVPPAASPIRRQYLALKQQQPDAILFFQLGDFYETFEDDARTVSEVCEIALTAREMGRGERMPMAGVPVHAAEVYIAKLVERGLHIAICRQMEDPSLAARQGSTIVRREIVRVITPGTLVDPELLPATRANYLAALAVERGRVGLAHVDISTGEFACTQIDGDESRELARAELARLQPAECLVASEQSAQQVLTGELPLTTDDSLFSASEAERILTQHFQVATLGALGLDERPAAAVAAAAILRYLARTQQRSSGLLERIQVYDAHGYMVIDPATRNHLELFRGARGRREGSLVQTLDRTRTAMGARTLGRWLGHPLLDRPAIEERLDRVTELLAHSMLLRELQDGLSPLPDLERLAGRAAQRLLTSREALALAGALRRAHELRELLDGAALASLAPLVTRIGSFEALAEEISATLVDDPPLSFGEGVIRAGRIAELDDLRSHSSDGRQWLVELERRERERTGVKNLKVGYNRVFGYYLEIGIAALGQALDYYRQQETGAQTVTQLLDHLGYQRRQTLASAERFVTAELREHEAKQARSATRMAELEREAFDALCEQVAGQVSEISATAHALAEIDALTSFAEIAQEQRYVRPEVLDEPVSEIVGGRHPVVERAIGWDAYIPGDIALGDPAHVIVLTGPNMAGKTTFGRMVLLVTLLGQCGSYVPAERARLGLVDRIFLRSGAGDDIAGGQSTFMVEMTETAAILRNASPRSLAFFDEVGRGTSTYDGMAIARAIVEHLAEPAHGCRTIFSTHYHELAAIEAERPGVCNYRMEVRETANQVSFTYRPLPGSADRSYGVHVARLAGLPGPVVARATEVLYELEHGARTAMNIASEPSPSAPVPEVVHDLAGIDIDYLTPVEALTTLARLRKDALDWLGSEKETS